MPQTPISIKGTEVYPGAQHTYIAFKFPAKIFKYFTIKNFKFFPENFFDYYYKGILLFL